MTDTPKNDVKLFSAKIYSVENSRRIPRDKKFPGEKTANDAFCKPMMEVQKPADVDNTDTEDEVAVPVPIHGDEPDRLLDIEVTGLPFHVADLSRLYGECHRGVVAAKAFEGGDFISAEGACAYVCVNVQQAGVQDGDDDSHSAMAYLAGASKERPYEQCPPELSPPHMDRGLYAALTGLLIRDCEVSRLVS